MDCTKPTWFFDFVLFHGFEFQCILYVQMGLSSLQSGYQILSLYCTINLQNVMGWLGSLFLFSSWMFGLILLVSVHVRILWTFGMGTTKHRMWQWVVWVDKTQEKTLVGSVKLAVMVTTMGSWQKSTVLLWFILGSDDRFFYLTVVLILVRGQTTCAIMDTYSLPSLLR